VRVPVWAPALGALLAAQTVLLLAAAAAVGALWLGSAERSQQSRQTLPARPDLVLRLDGFPAGVCQPDPLQPAGCGSGSSTPRRLGTEVHILPGSSKEIVVEQRVEVRAAGAALASRYLAGAAVRAAASADSVGVSVPAWNPWDPRLLEGHNRVTLVLPPQVRLVTGAGPSGAGAPGSGTSRRLANPGNEPNAPNVPNTPNAPAGRQGQSVHVAAEATWPGEASAWQGDVTVDGEVRGDVVVVGGTATVNGVVDGSVSVWNGAAVVAAGAHVGGSVSVVSGSLSVRPGAQVGGGVTAWRPAGPVTVSGTVARDARVVDGGLDLAAGARVGGALMAWSPPSPVQVDGAIRGDAGVLGGGLRFGPQASVGGHVRVWRGSCAGAPC
jgi:hypothetical protein